jgi:hypothetical protein
MEKSESIKNLTAALAKAQSALSNAKNTADNPFYKSKYAPLGDVLDLIRPVLAKNDLSVVQYPSSQDGKAVSIHTMLIHASGEYIDFDPLTLTAEKITPQGAGAAITYGRRYTVSGIFNIASEDDDDGNGLESKKPVTYKSKQPVTYKSKQPVTYKSKQPAKKINPEQANEISNLLKQTKSNIPNFLKYYHLTKVEDMTESVYERAERDLMSKLK